MQSKDLVFNNRTGFFDNHRIKRIKDENLFRPKSRTSFYADTRSFYFESIRSRGEFMKRVLDETFNEYSCGMRFPPNDKLYESFNRKIQQLHEAGITNHIIESYKKYLDPKYYQKPVMTHKKYLETTHKNSFEDGPQVLTVKNLEFGFVIWLVTLILPIIAFTIECFVQVIKKNWEYRQRTEEVNLVPTKMSAKRREMKGQPENNSKKLDSDETERKKPKMEIPKNQTMKQAWC
jgi:hypothetical protein